MSMTQDDSANPKPVRVIGCGMIAREILAISEQLGFEHIDLKCLPAMWHHYPDKIAPGVDEAITKAKNEGFEHIFVAYADCGTGGHLDAVCEKHGVERIAGPHCFSFYMGNQDFEDQGDELLTSFFMTDFLARHFETFLVKPLGLDRHPELRDMYFAHYTRMLYIAQTDDEVLTQNAIKAAEFLGLEYEKRLTGYGDLSSSLAALQN
ncbi:MAG: DUF1638 domain-containing protein [Hyphomicrobiales bacterium]|nr:DUF1638 domain-containing protein [Hyphomicrobiales bacterium]